jgi:hypothetical protein
MVSLNWERAKEGSFPVVWACREEKWQAARAEQREPVAIP